MAKFSFTLEFSKGNDTLWPDQFQTRKSPNATIRSRDGNENSCRNEWKRRISLRDRGIEDHLTIYSLTGGQPFSSNFPEKPKHQLESIKTQRKRQKRVSANGEHRGEEISPLRLARRNNNPSVGERKIARFLFRFQLNARADAAKGCFEGVAISTAISPGR